MDNTKIDIIISKYFSNEITSEENDFLKNWVSESDENMEIFTAYSDLNRQSIDALHLINNKKRPVIKLTNFWKYAVAASIFIGFLTLMFFYFKPSKVSNEIIISFDGAKKFELKNGQQIKDENNKLIGSFGNNILDMRFATQNAKNLQIKVPAGKKMSVLLQDGSFVQINSATELSFPVNFEQKKSREIYLNGEALFAVKKNPEKPFLVNTQKFVTQVLGTKFNVNSYQTDKEKSVTLIEGSVKVTNKQTQQQTKLTPGESFVVENKSAKATVARTMNVKNKIAWSRNEIIFDNEYLENIFKTIERNFNVEIINQDQEIIKRKFSGTFKNQSIESILKTLEISLNCKMEKNGSKITITPSK